MLVDSVGLDHYAMMAAACEVPSDWPGEALRAQAVASRSYAVATRQPGGRFDAYPDTRSQSACPVEHVDDRIVRAVEATGRQVVTYHGHVATTFYSSSSGGRTSSISASWGGTNQPYLVPVRDRYDGAGGRNPNHTWDPVRYRPKRLADLLDLAHRVTRVDTTIDRPSRRVLRLTVHTRGGGSAHLSAGAVFADLGLRSTYFRLRGVTLDGPARLRRGDSFTLRGRLWPRPHGRWRLQLRRPGEDWQRVRAHVRLARDGRFSLRRSPRHDIRYRVELKAAFSPVVRVDVTG